MLIILAQELKDFSQMYLIYFHIDINTFHMSAQPQVHEKPGKTPS